MLIKEFADSLTPVFGNLAMIFGSLGKNACKTISERYSYIVKRGL